MTPYFADDAVTLWHGDALDVLAGLDDGSVDCIVTSPPYFGLRDYGVQPTEWPEVTYAPIAGMPEVTIPAQRVALGAEDNPAAFIGHLVVLFAEARRVLADDGTLWLNLGDSYSAARGQGNVGGGLEGGPRPSFREDRAPAATRAGIRYGVPNKNLLGIPWRAAFALQSDGWILRNDVVWNKPNAMPESVTDRLSTRHEHLFVLSKSRRYWFDLDPIREPVATTRAEALSWARDSKEADVPGQSTRQHRSTRETYIMPTGSQHTSQHEHGRNPGDVWTIATQPFPGAHFATMPVALAERAIQAGCKPGGVVLDMFSGSGTTGLAAARHGCRYVGIDLNADYLDLSLRTRLAQGGLVDIEGASA